MTQGYKYHKLWKTFGQVFRSYAEFLSKFGDISFPEYVSKGISLLRWSSLQTMEGQSHTECHLVGFENSKTPSTTTVWPIDHREYYRSCAWPFYSLCRPLLKHCTLTNKAVGTIWRDLSKPPQRRQGSDLRVLWLLVGRPLAIRLYLASRRMEHILPYSNVTRYICDITYYLRCICIDIYDLSGWFGCCFVVYLRRFV